MGAEGGELGGGEVSVLEERHNSQVAIKYLAQHFNNSDEPSKYQHHIFDSPAYVSHIPPTALLCNTGPNLCEEINRGFFGGSSNPMWCLKRNYTILMIEDITWF